MPETLPHAYPFRFVDRVSVPAQGPAADSSWQGRVEAQVSASSWAARDGCFASPMILAEAIAQAALLLAYGPAVSCEAFLASRIAGAAPAAFGTLPRGSDCDALMARVLEL